MIHCFNTHMEHEVGSLAKGQEQRQSIGGALDSCQGCRQQLAHCICTYQTPTTSNQAASGHHRRPEQTIQSNQSTAIYGADPPQQSRLSPGGLGANEQRHSMFNQQQHAHETSSQTNSNLAPPQASGNADRIHQHHHHASSTKQQPINQISSPDAIECHQRDRNDLLIKSSHHHQSSGAHRVDSQIDNIERNARHKCEGHPESHPSTDLYDRLYGLREDQDPHQHQAGLNDDWTNQFQSFDFGALHQEEPFPTESQHNQHSSTSSLRNETSNQTTTTSGDPHGSYRSSSSSSSVVVQQQQQQQQVDAKPSYDLNNNQNSNELSSGQHDSDGTLSFARLMPPMVEPISHLHSHQDQRNNQQQTTGSNEYYQQHYTGGPLDQQQQHQPQHISSSSSEAATSNPYLNSVSQHQQHAISSSSPNGTGELAGTTNEPTTGTPDGVGSNQHYHHHHHHQYQSLHLGQQQHHHYEHQGSSSSSFQEFYTYTNCDANPANPGPCEQQHGAPPTQAPYHSYGLEDQGYHQQQHHQHEHDGEHYQRMQEQVNCYQQQVPPTEACGNSHLLMVSGALSASISSSASTVSSSNSPIHQQQQQQKAQTLCAPLTSNGQNGGTANTPMKKLMKSIHSTSGSRTATSGGSCGKAATIATSGRSRRGRPRKKGSCAKGKVSGKLWEFIRDLLLSERTNPSFIRWERREDGVFKFVQSDKVAKMWGERKQNPKMTYEKLSRAMRYYYKSKVLLPVFGRRLVYKFGPNATGWMAVSSSCSSTSPSSLSGGPNSNSSSLGGGNLSPPVVSSSVALSSGSGGTTPMDPTAFYPHPHQQQQQQQREMSQVGDDQVMQVIAVEAQQQRQQQQQPQQQQYGLVQYDQGHLLQAGPDQQTILHGNHHHQHNEIIY